MKKPFRISLFSAAMAAMLAFAPVADANNRSVVRDKDGDVIVNTFQNCVRTRWDAGSDACGAVAAPTYPVYVPVADAPVQPVLQRLDRNYMVFFDWDKSNLTPEAQQVVGDLHQQTKDAETRRYEVVGHADRSGPDSYNMQLSQRRANAVKAEMVRMGANEGDIVVRWEGEASPLVPTGDGVREPQNRRASIKVIYDVWQRQGQ